MKYKLFESIHDMLAPRTLHVLTGRATGAVQMAPFGDRQGVSGNQFWTVDTEQGARFVLKRMSYDIDWLMRATEDVHCRSATLWQSGLLDRLLPDVDPVIIACARDEDGWAILMPDLSPGMMPLRGYLDLPTNDRIMHALAVIHARFWEEPLLCQSSLGLGTLQQIMQGTTPTVHSLPKYKIGWERLPDIFEPDVVAVLRALMADPQPFSDAMARFPRTLVHGDYKPTNLLWRDRCGGHVAALDWQLAFVGLGTIELGWYLSSAYPSTMQTNIDLYRSHLESQLGYAFPDLTWRVMLELGLLGSLVRSSCSAAWRLSQEDQSLDKEHALQMIPAWTRWVRSGVQWL